MSDLDFQEQIEIPQTPRRRRALLPRLICATSVLYLIILATLAVLLWTMADRWWPVTILLYSPRWVMTLPMFLLIPLTATLHRKSLVILGIAAIVLVWPLLGLRIPLHGSMADASKPSLRILSCNIHRRQLNTGDFRDIIDQIKPDVIALQDWSSEHQGALFGDDAWHFRRDGELFLASRFPIVEAHWIRLDEPPLPKFTVRLGAAMYYRLETPAGMISVINLHLSSPHLALQQIWESKDVPEQLAFNGVCREQEMTTIEDIADRVHEPLVILGDFNTPPESRIFRDHWLGYTNAFNAVGLGFGTTHASTMSSVRIDHILLNDHIAVRRCWLEQPAGSPHKPLVADVVPAAGDASVAGTGP